MNTPYVAIAKIDNFEYSIVGKDYLVHETLRASVADAVKAIPQDEIVIISDTRVTVGILQFYVLTTKQYNDAIAAAYKAGTRYEPCPTLIPEVPRDLRVSDVFRYEQQRKKHGY